MELTVVGAVRLWVPSVVPWLQLWLSFRFVLCCSFLPFGIDWIDSDVPNFNP